MSRHETYCAAEPKAAHRFLIALAIGESAAVFMWTVRTSRPDLSVSDLTPLVHGAVSWWHHGNPYAAVDPPLLYPFPAVLAVAPLMAVPGVLLNAIWVGIGAGVLAYAVTRKRLWSPALLLCCLSPAFAHAIQMSQWSPLLTAVALLPSGGWFYACKPTTAAWLFAYRPNPRHAIEALIAFAVSLVAWPGWPGAWIGSLSHAQWTVAPVTVAGGPLALLAALKWRRPEARLLVTMACVPHTPLLYETVPLGLIPQTWTEAAVLWIGMLIARLGDTYGRTSADPHAATVSSATWIIWAIYLPALVIILRRPNVWPKTSPPAHPT